MGAARSNPRSRQHSGASPQIATDGPRVRPELPKRSVRFIPLVRTNPVTKKPERITAGQVVGFSDRAYVIGPKGQLLRVRPS